MKKNLLYCSKTSGGEVLRFAYFRVPETPSFGEAVKGREKKRTPDLNESEETKPKIEKKLARLSKFDVRVKAWETRRPLDAGLGVKFAAHEKVKTRGTVNLRSPQTGEVIGKVDGRVTIASPLERTLLTLDADHPEGQEIFIRVVAEDGVAGFMSEKYLRPKNSHAFHAPAIDVKNEPSRSILSYVGDGVKYAYNFVSSIIASGGAKKDHAAEGPLSFLPEQIRPKYEAYKKGLLTELSGLSDRAGGTKIGKAVKVLTQDLTKNFDLYMARLFGAMDLRSNPQLADELARTLVAPKFYLDGESANGKKTQIGEDVFAETFPGKEPSIVFNRNLEPKNAQAFGHVVMHELIHGLQTRNFSTFAQRTVGEGGVDALAEVATGKKVETAYEGEKKFARRLISRNAASTSRWILGMIKDGEFETQIGMHITERFVALRKSALTKGVGIIKNIDPFIVNPDALMVAYLNSEIDEKGIMAKINPQIRVRPTFPVAMSNLMGVKEKLVDDTAAYLQEVEGKIG